MNWVQALKLLADPTRLRLLAVLQHDNLSVAELQEVLNMGQSRISTHLGILRKGGLLTDQREGKKIFYQWSPDLAPSLIELIQTTLEHATLSREFDRDQETLKTVLKRRREQTQAYFNALAGRADKKYCPGRSWQNLAHLFLELIPPSLEIADLGAGEGLISRSLALRAKKVIAVDNSEKMVKHSQQQAEKLGLKNLEFRMGDLEASPIEKNSVDVVIFSQALHHAANPQRALQAAYTLLRNQGKLLILDLKQHHYEAARKLYSDTWLGFRENDLTRWLKRCGFTQVFCRLLEREEKKPHFQPLLASAIK
ncbi:MAG: metalloregulator ArsR/SmtB family transcription factor [Verrucomicrobiia bacterium]